MNKALFKDTWRTMERTKSRFISLVAIVALGISFFAGIHATAPDMRDTATQYYIDTNAMDLQVISTAGLTDDNARAIAAFRGGGQAGGPRSPADTRKSHLLLVCYHTVSSFLVFR